MYLYVLLACVLRGLASRSSPMKITSVSLYDNHTAICAEIQHDLSADNTTYSGDFESPQNTSKESCYGEFMKSFISTLKNLTEKHQNDHLEKVYKNMKELKRTCTKLHPTEPPTNCATELTDFSQFKEALKTVVMYIEFWKSCKRTGDSL